VKRIRIPIIYVVQTTESFKTAHDFCLILDFIADLNEMV